MLGLRVDLSDAERARKYLASHGMADETHKILRKSSFIYIPLAASASALKELRKAGLGTVVNATFERSQTRESYRAVLKKEFGKGYAKMAKSYDLYGDIATIEADASSAKKIARAIMLVNGNVRTVLRKGGAVEGEYRTRKYLHVAGKRTYTATYRENGCTFAFDLRKAFFSPRLAFERQRVASLVKDGETVVDMFAGVGPFAIEIARSHRRSRVIANELNRDAYESLEANIRLNRVTNVVAVEGDAKALAKKYRGKADRLIMHHPTRVMDFLDAALALGKKRCTVHYYVFGDTEKGLDEHKAMLAAFFKSRGRRCAVLCSRIVRPYSAREVEFSIDISVS